MAFNVLNFRAALLQHGVMKPSKFLIRLQQPPGLPGNFQNLVRDLELWATAAELPSMGVMTWQAKRYGYGPTERRVMAPIFEPMAIKFNSDVNGQIWEYFYAWQNLMVNSNMRGSITSALSSGQTPYEIAYKSEYLTDLEIYVFREDDADNPVKTVILRDAFPTNVGAITLDWSIQNAHSIVPTVWAYTDFFEVPIEGQKNFSTFIPSTDNAS